MANKIKEINNKLKDYEVIISLALTIVSLIISVGAFFISKNSLDLATKGANLDITISRMFNPIKLKEDGEYPEFTGWLTYDEEGKGLELYVNKDEYIDPYIYGDDKAYKIDTTICNYLCFDISNNGKIASKNTYVDIEFNGLYVVPKEDIDTVWTIKPMPFMDEKSILGLRYLYDENELIYPNLNNVKQLYIDLSNNYDIWIKEGGGEIKVSIAGENSILKEESFFIKIKEYKK